MSFVRVFIGRSSNIVRHVIEQSVPFEGKGAAMIKDTGEELEVVDLGFAEPHDWKDVAGRPCSPSRHIFERLEHPDPAVRRDMPTIHESPVTVEGIQQRLRERGPAGIPVKVRAWLANVMAPERVQAMGIARGLPLSALKGAEAWRNRVDPAAGSRMLVIERAIQARADRMLAARVRGAEQRAKRAAAKAAGRAAKARAIAERALAPTDPERRSEAARERIQKAWEK